MDDLHIPTRARISSIKIESIAGTCFNSRGKILLYHTYIFPSYVKYISLTSNNYLRQT